MVNNDPKPLLTLTEQSEKQPSRLILDLSAISRLQRTRFAFTSFLAAITRGLGKIFRMKQSAEINEFLSYVPKRDKVTEGALWLLERAQEGGQAMPTDQLATAMFLADKAHLDAYGRPVFFDNYIATKNGPAGVAAMEMLDSSHDWTSQSSDSAPWKVENAQGQFFPRPARSPNMRRLSETDVEALESALGLVVNLDVGQLRLFTHRNKAYADAWDDGRGAGLRLDPRLIPDKRDDEMIDNLLYASRHAYVAPSRK